MNIVIEEKPLVSAVYCDKIAADIKAELLTQDFYSYVSPVKMDLDIDEGYLVSTKKEIFVEDNNDTCYKVTIEEYIPDLS